SGSAVTVNPANDLLAGTQYYVTVDSGAIQDIAGNAYAGISSATAFNFTTAAAGSGTRPIYDFDGDGKSDLLLQSDAGQNAVWLMNGASVLTSANVGAAVASLHAKAAGDFDGDGRADILLQDDSGQPTMWLMNGTSITTAAAIGSNPGTAWHV